MNSFTPSQLSPLARQGHSLDTRTVNCSQGVMTNIDELFRPSTKAKLIRNFHQFSRGVFSSGNGGWVRDLASGLNGGNQKFLDFGLYYDGVSSAPFLMAQVGNTLYNYDTAAHSGASISGMTALSTTLLPCIRPSSATASTTNPFSIYCNGGTEPRKVYNATAGNAPNASAVLGFNSGNNTIAIAVTGVISTGSMVFLTISSPQIAVSPTIISYTVAANDSAIDVARNLAANVNANTTLSTANITALGTGSTVTLTYPTALTVAVVAGVPNVETVKVGGSAANGNILTVTFTSTAIAGSPVNAVYTEITGDTTTTAATGLAASINNTPALAQAGISAIAFSTYVTISYPKTTTIAFSQTASGSATLTLDAGLIEVATITGTPVNTDLTHVVFTSSAIAGSPLTVNYTQVTGDTINTVATGLMNAINATAALTSVGFAADSAGNMVVISYPSLTSTAPTFANTGTTGVTLTLAASIPSNGIILTVTNGSLGAVFPGTFGGLVYTKPGLCAPFGSRMAYAAFANSGASGNAVTQQLLVSAQGDSESFPLSVPTRATDGFSIPIPAICGAPTFLRSLKLNTNNSSEVLIIGCQSGMCILKGTDATNFSLEIHSTEFGFPSNRASAQLDNSLVFMATDGFRVYSGENNNSNLLTDGIALDIYDEFLKIDRANWQKSHCIHHRDTQEVWFWVPYTADAGDCQHAFIYNYNTLDGQPIWYFKDNTKCLASIEYNHTFYGGNDIGLVQKWYGVNNYDDSSSGLGSPANVLPGAQIILALIGVGNLNQFCSIEKVTISAGQGDQKFLMNASTYELMDNGATRKQQMQPYNFTVQSASTGQTVLGPASPAQWTLDFSAFPQLNSKFLSDYVPQGHGRKWEFTITCNDTSHNCDFTNLEAAISIGGQRV